MNTMYMLKDCSVFNYSCIYDIKWCELYYISVFEFRKKELEFYIENCLITSTLEYIIT